MLRLNNATMSFLLLNRLGEKSLPNWIEPLSLDEFYALCDWFKRRKLDICHYFSLLEEEKEELGEEFSIEQIDELIYRWKDYDRFRLRYLCNPVSKSNNVSLISLFDARYPKRLVMKYLPPVLYTCGNTSLLAGNPTVAGIEIGGELGKIWRLLDDNHSLVVVCMQGLTRLSRQKNSRIYEALEEDRILLLGYDTSCLKERQDITVMELSYRDAIIECLKR